MENKSTISIRFTSLVLAGLTTISLSGCSLNKDKSNEIATTTTVVTTIDNKDNISSATNQIDITSFKTNTNTEKTSNSDITKEFNSNISKFSNEVQTRLKEMFNKMYTTNDDINELLKPYGFPSKETILEEKIVKPLKTIDSIRIVHDTDKDYEKQKQEVGTACYIPGENSIYIIDDEEEFRYQALGEEIIHSTQKKLIHSKAGDPEFYIFGEGEANMLSWNLTDNYINNYPSFRFNDNNNDKNIYYNWGVGNYKYSVNTKYYTQLITLLGYDTINEYRNTLNDKVITDKLSSLYGIDGVKYFNDMKSVIDDAQNDVTNQKANVYLNNEKMYYICLNKQINSTKDKEQLLQLFNIYRYMNIQYGFDYCECDNDYNEINKTKVKLDNSELENNLFNKLESYNIFDNLSTNRIIQNNIFNIVLHPVKDQYEKNLPITLNNVRLDYSNNEVIMYTNTNTVFTNTKTNIVKATNKVNYNDGEYIFTNSTQKVKS